MKKLLLVAILIFASAFFYKNYYLTSGSVKNQISSPLPGFLTNTSPSVLGANAEFFLPNINNLTISNVKKPDVTAESAISYDLSTGQLLFAKNIRRRLPLASLTKIMTATVALQNAKIDDKFTVSKSAATVGEDSMGLTEGESLTLGELLYGLMLSSGNDAAETIAQDSRFGRDNFVYLMNKEAEDLGLTDTHFTNPTGLQGDGNQYSSAYDLLVMSRFALENSDFARVASTYEYDIPATDTHKEYHLYNETNLLTSYPGVKGVKTGYTYEAGLCLVTYLDYEGHKIIAVLLNAQNRRQEMKDLLDYSLKTLGVNPPQHQ